MKQDAGHFYDLRMRLRGKLAPHMASFTPSQTDAWRLLNEVDALVKLVEQTARYLSPDLKPDLVYEIQHTLLGHMPKWKYLTREGEIIPPQIGECHR